MPLPFPRREGVRPSDAVLWTAAGSSASHTSPDSSPGLPHSHWLRAISEPSESILPHWNPWWSHMTSPGMLPWTGWYGSSSRDIFFLINWSVFLSHRHNLHNLWARSPGIFLGNNSPVHSFLLYWEHAAETDILFPVHPASEALQPSYGPRLRSDTYKNRHLLGLSGKLLFLRSPPSPHCRNVPTDKHLQMFSHSLWVCVQTDASESSPCHPVRVFWIKSP